MNKMFNRGFYFFLVVAVIMCCLGVSVNESAEVFAAYSGPYTTVGEVTMPLEEYMPGSYFTKDGGPCDCHYSSSINCVKSGSRCNCLRYVEYNGEKVDLQAVQCIGFARYVFMRLFGFPDTYGNDHLYYSLGSLSRGEVTTAAVKELLSDAKPGAHIRFKLSSSQHSVILLSKNDSGFTVYHCNAGGPGIDRPECVVTTKSYTWASFADYAYRGIVYVNMPNDYPDYVDQEAEAPDESGPVYSLGTYVTTANLNLRQGAGTEFPKAEVLPKGTEFEVVATEGIWGQTQYNGSYGWVSLEYAAYVGDEKEEEDVPKLDVLTLKENVCYINDGFLYGVNPRTALDGCTKLFANDYRELAITVISTQFVGTGTVISLVRDGELLDELTLVVQGDLNGDGEIDGADFELLGKVLMGKGDLKGTYKMAADLNSDSTFNTTDYIKQKMSAASAE